MEVLTAENAPQSYEMLAITLLMQHGTRWLAKAHTAPVSLNILTPHTGLIQHFGYASAKGEQQGGNKHESSCVYICLTQAFGGLGYLVEIGRRAS